MAMVNGGTYARQNPCDGWVDNLEPTLLMAVIYFLIEGHNLKKTIHDSLINYLRDKSKLFRAESRVNDVFCKFIIDFRYNIFGVFRGPILAIKSCNLSAFFSRDAVHFNTNMQYSKAFMKYKVNCLFSVFSRFGECIALGWVWLLLAYTYHFLSPIPGNKEFGPLPSLLSSSLRERKINNWLHSDHIGQIYQYSSYDFFYRSYTAEELHNVLGWRQQQGSGLGVHTSSQSYNKIQIHDLGEWWDLCGTISMRRLDRWPGIHAIGWIRELVPSSIDNR